MTDLKIKNLIDGHFKQLKYKEKCFILIDDSYNSNPASLIASLKSFSKLKVIGKKFLVLGDMQNWEKKVKTYTKI